MQCYEHADVLASGSCQDCGRALCSACTDRFQPVACAGCFETRTREETQTLWWRFLLTAALIGCGPLLTFAIPRPPAFDSGKTFLAGLLLGYCVAALYWGWLAVSEMTPRMWIVGTPKFWVFYAFVKLFLASLIGGFAAPIMLSRTGLRLHKLSTWRSQLPASVVQPLFDARLRSRTAIVGGVAALLLLQWGATFVSRTKTGDTDPPDPLAASAPAARPGEARRVAASPVSPPPATSSESAEVAKPTRSGTTDTHSLIDRRESIRTEARAGHRAGLASGSEAPQSAAGVRRVGSRSNRRPQPTNRASETDEPTEVRYARPPSLPTQKSAEMTAEVTAVSARGAAELSESPPARRSFGGPKSSSRAWTPRTEPWIGDNGRLIIPAPPP